MRNIEQFIGVFNYSNLERLRGAIEAAAPHHELIMFIFNPFEIEELQQAAGHFMAVVLDQERHSICLYDPQPLQPEPRLVEFLEQLLHEGAIDNEHMYKFKENKVVRQPMQSNDCGFFSVLFLLRYLLSQDFKYASMFDPTAN